MPVYRERTNDDVINISSVWNNAGSIPNHGVKKPSKCDNSNENAPKKKFVVEY